MIRLFVAENCPMCEVLKKKLTQKEVAFTTVDITKEENEHYAMTLAENGYAQTPVMEVTSNLGTELYRFDEANAIINEI